VNRARKNSFAGEFKALLQLTEGFNMELEWHMFS
jgi:hypothetical protein